VIDDILPATEGAGPLLQRDYWAVLADCPLKPSEVIERVTARFCELPPPSLVDFAPAADGALGHGSEIDINIKPAQHCRVRVIHKDANSITLGTLVGHPEAGRITFGAYRNPNGEVIFHIRSRARSSSTGKRLGFLAIGDAMQTNTWTDFINNTAAMLDTPIKGVIHVEKEEVEEEDQDEEPLNDPTFIAKGD
jgi:hypothetical protein